MNDDKSIILFLDSKKEMTESVFQYLKVMFMSISWLELREDTHKNVGFLVVEPLRRVEGVGGGA